MPEYDYGTLQTSAQSLDYQQIKPTTTYSKEGGKAIISLIIRIISHCLSTGTSKGCMDNDEYYPIEALLLMEL